MRKHLINENYLMTFFSLLTLFAFVFTSFGQNQKLNMKTEWTRIEGENREVSVSVPSDFLVNTEPDNDRKRILIDGFSKDVEMIFSILKPVNPKQNLKSVRISEESDQVGNSFEMNGLKGKNLVSKNPHQYINTFLLASNDYLYRISVIAKLNSNKEIVENQTVARFINSIKVNGQQLIVPTKQYVEPADKIVAASNLRTSPLILEVLEKKDSKKAKDTEKYKLKYETSDDNSIPDEVSYSRPLIILRQPIPRYSDSARILRITGSVKLKVNFLANGEVGEITVLSKIERGLEGNAAEAAHKIKFLPAEINGKAVDAAKEITYNFAVY